MIFVFLWLWLRRMKLRQIMIKWRRWNVCWFTFSLSRVWNVNDWEYGLQPNLFWDLQHPRSWNCIRKLVFSTLETFKMWPFPQYIFAYVHTLLCKYIFVILCALPPETFVTSVATSLARVVTLTATFSAPAICGLCFIIYTNAGSATLSILLHPNPIATSQPTDL